VTRPDRRRRYATSLHFAALVVDTVSNHFGIPVSILRSSVRTRTVSHVRHVAMYTLTRATSLSRAEIGAALGGFDPTTVLHACRSVEIALSDDPELRRDLLRVAQAIADRQQGKLETPVEVKRLTAG
jgi:chromosomal replication initiation ATPase DnaA